jgi:glycosyltransferase involved in cell wall biosynthesis
VPNERTIWIPNSIDISKYPKPSTWRAREEGSMVWCSSPDRGLHHILGLMPDIQEQVPRASLKIFYRLDPWIARVENDEHFPVQKKRARYIRECLEKLGRNGENGVTVLGPRLNREVVEALTGAELLPYSCDTERFTEGFSVSILDACASGALPLISDVDAIGDIYGGIARVIHGKPGPARAEWLKAIVEILQEPEDHKISRRRACYDFAKRFDRENVAYLWSTLVESGKLNDMRYIDGLRIDSMVKNIDHFVELARNGMKPHAQVAAQMGSR